MNPAVLIASVYVFALAAFLGYQVISQQAIGGEMPFSAMNDGP